MEGEITDKKRKSLEKALLKKALGYSFDEIIEEYTLNKNGELKLAKRKVTKTFVPPDIPAAKVLLESGVTENQFSNMTKEELLAEKQRLLKELAESQKKNKK